jgi:RNA polymerase sigma-70 factor (ECF subfamily)
MARGDRRALATLYERHAPVLFGLALRIVRERREAEDLLHDVFLEAWRTAKDFDPERGRVSTWLAVRMRSRALDLRRSARVSRAVGDRGLEVSVDDSKPASPDHTRVRAALNELGADHRHVLELAYFEGDRIAIPVGTVKSRMAAGLSRLRSALGAASSE